jgi:hypothetical protein
MKRSVLQFICTLCLLFAQQAAFTHALWHAHEPSVQRHDRHDNSSAHGELCKLHGLFTQVVGGAPGTIVQLVLEDALNEQSPHVASAVLSTSLLTPRSRGPPRLS